MKFESFQYVQTKYMLTVKEAADVLGVSIHTVYRLINEGTLPAKKISERKTVILVKEIVDYIDRK